MEHELYRFVTKASKKSFDSRCIFHLRSNEKCEIYRKKYIDQQEKYFKKGSEYMKKANIGSEFTKKRGIKTGSLLLALVMLIQFVPQLNIAHADPLPTNSAWINNDTSVTYGDVKDAIDAASDGDVIHLSGNVTSPGFNEINKDVTLDVAHDTTIQMSYGNSILFELLRGSKLQVRDGATLTIPRGWIIPKENSEITISDTAQLVMGDHITMWDHASLKVKDSAKLKTRSIVVYIDSKVEITDSATVNVGGVQWDDKIVLEDRGSLLISGNSNVTIQGYLDARNNSNVLIKGSPVVRAELITSTDDSKIQVISGDVQIADLDTYVRLVDTDDNFNSIVSDSPNANDPLKMFRLTDSTITVLPAIASNGHSYSYTVLERTIPGTTTVEKYAWVPFHKVTYQLKYRAASFADGTKDDKVTFTISGYPLNMANKVYNQDIVPEGVPTSSRAGDTFIGWFYKDENGNEKEFKPLETILTGDTVVYDVWKKAPSSSGSSEEEETPEVSPQQPQVPLTSNESKQDNTTRKLNKVDHYSYMVGYPDGTFRADSQMTRAEVTMMFARLLKDRPNGTPFMENRYRDVQETNWFSYAVDYMSEQNIIKGYPDGTFRPNEPITRAEFAAISARFDKLSDEGNSTFTDVSENHWASKVIAQAGKKGWVSGYPDGTFKPNQNITRVEVVSSTNRILNRYADIEFAKTNKEKLATMTDIAETHWGYGAIVEAMNGHDYVRLEDGKAEKWERLNLKSFDFPASLPQ